jgi:peptidoglycan/xylan/chitin deacetylase (PgdA/CDA1 family)
MRKRVALTVSTVMGIIGLVITSPQAIVPVLRILFPHVVWDIRTRGRAVALTFDDGPDPKFTPRVLEILRRYGITATFLLVGERVRRFPELLQQIRDGGHGVGNHTDSWRRTIRLSNDEFEHDLLRAEESIGSCTPPKLFRPAGGMLRAKQMQVLRKHQYRVVLGSAYAFDPYRPPKKYIEWAITRGLKPGAIIVLHDSGGERSNSVDALPAIIEYAQAAGYCFVNLSEVIQSSGR